MHKSLHFFSSSSSSCVVVVYYIYHEKCSYIEKKQIAEETEMVEP